MKIGQSFSKADLSNFFGVTSSPFQNSILEIHRDKIAYLYLNPSMNLGVHKGVDHIVLCGLTGANRRSDRERIREELSIKPCPLFALEPAMNKPLTYMGEFGYVGCAEGEHAFRHLAWWIVNPEPPDYVEEVLFLERKPSKQETREKNYDHSKKLANEGLIALRKFKIK